MTEIGREAIILDRVFSGLVAQGVAIVDGLSGLYQHGREPGALAHQGADLAVDEFRRLGHFDEFDGDCRGAAR